jgi:2-polyprenyl-6-methoxyphenol hydroxylase-like FAD-dependent oxidoreductase
MTNKPILIVGAGPSGLVLALSLARRGVTFRIISDAKGPGEHSRAMAVHARTLEFYQQFGFADDVVAAGIRTQHVHLREAGASGHAREIKSFSFDDLGGGISPFPFVLTYPQDDHERLLVSKLDAENVHIEWNTKLTSFIQDESGVHATIAHTDGQTENADFDYICGCDGAHSQVRQSLKLGFSGGTYDQLFYVADVKIASGFDTDMWVNLGSHILTLMLPVRSTGMQRLIGLVPPELSNRHELTFEHIRAPVETLTNLRVTAVNWFSTYRVHHRVADHFHAGRAFLLGDAGHIHSPAGGQGMNTGIGDAINLGWKLAAVINNKAAPTLLDTYEPERIGFARKLVASTDRAFTLMVADGIGGELYRRFVAPLAFRVITSFAATRHAAFRTVSQTHISYCESPLSEGRAGHIHAGDRLPWTGAEGPDNFADLKSLDWQVHVYGEPERTLEETCRTLNIPLHVYPWTEAAGKTGFTRGATYLVRPDGYVGLAVATGAPGALSAYAGRVFQ